MPMSETKSIKVLTTTTSNNAYRSIPKMGVGFYRTNQSSGQIYHYRHRLYYKIGRSRALKDNTATSTARFTYEEIVTKFGCPITLVSDQGSHFLNETIQILTKTFIVLHCKSTIYYPQANGQAENTNKVIKSTFTKMANANRTDWDTKLYAALWAYKTAYKVTTMHTPFSLVFGMETLLPLTFIYNKENLQRNKN